MAGPFQPREPAVDTPAPAHGHERGSARLCGGHGLGHEHIDDGALEGSGDVVHVIPSEAEGSRGASWKRRFAFGAFG